MADLQLQVPQQVKHCFRRLPLLRRRNLRGQEHEVEVAEGRHLAAARAAEADEHELFAQRLVEQAFIHEVVDQPDKLVVEESRGLRGRSSVTGFLGQAFRDFRPAMFKGIAQDRRRSGRELLAGTLLGKPLGYGSAVDDRAAILDIEKVHHSRSDAKRLSR